MRLFVQQDEYMPNITESAGFRLVVHGPDKMPFPEDDGIAISPGFQTAVAARIVSNGSIILVQRHSPSFLLTMVGKLLKAINANQKQIATVCNNVITNIQTMY